MAIATLTDTDYDPLFKKYYYKLADNVYNSFDSLYSQVPKVFGVGGRNGEHPVEVTFGGGVGSSPDGTLPLADHASFLRPVYEPKRQYARVNIDGYTIEASEKTEHAFISAIDQEVTSKIKSFNRNCARALLNDGTGILGQFSGSAGGTAAAPTMTILTTGRYRRRKAAFEKGDAVNIVVTGATLLSSVFKITSYAASTGLLTLQRLSGSDDLTGIGAGTHNIVMQNSRNVDPYGFLGICFDSTYYTVAQEERWKPFVLTGTSDSSAGSAPLDTDMLNDIIIQMETETDETPTNIVMSPLQYRKYISLLESQKRFPVPVDMKPRPNKMTSPELIARVSFGGIQYVGSQGNITVSHNRFMRDDMVLFCNMNHTEVAAVKKPGWAERDGTVFLRMEDRDAYESRYVLYSETRINPFFVGFIQDLAIS